MVEEVSGHFRSPGLLGPRILQVLFLGYRIVPPAEIRSRLFPLPLMDTRQTKLTSEDRMACEMPNNLIMLANSNTGKTPRVPISEKLGDNYELMTEAEVIHFLRIPEISNSKDYHNVLEHLKRIRGLPRIHICRKALYPRKAILDWVEKETNAGK